ncbi:unnamed protein product, partial [marine sediment metagenome]
LQKARARELIDSMGIGNSLDGYLPTGKTTRDVAADADLMALFIENMEAGDQVPF